MPIDVKWPVGAVEMNCPAQDGTQAAALLASGGVLILETDTLPGFHARADHVEAVARIRRLKQRSSQKPFLVLAGSIEQAWNLLAPLSSRVQEFGTRNWPGPFTLILPGAGRVAPGVEAAAGTLAVRVPDHALLRQLILAVGFPLVSTSVNLDGQAPCRNLRDAAGVFGADVDGCWGNREAGAEAEALPSALVDLTGPQPTVLRPGPLPFLR